MAVKADVFAVDSIRSLVPELIVGRVADLACDISSMVAGELVPIPTFPSPKIVNFTEDVQDEA